MTQRERKAFDALEELDRRSVLIGHISAVLGYDFETVMSKKGGDERASQMAFLSSMDHEISSSERMRELLEELSNMKDATDEQKALVDDLTVITGQKPMLCRAKKSISNFKLREGMVIGAVKG